MKMYNENFDPLLDLEILKQRLVDLEANFARLVAAHNSHTQLIQQITRQNTELLEQMAIQRQYIDTFFTSVNKP